MLEITKHNIERSKFLSRLKKKGFKKEKKGIYSRNGIVYDFKKTDWTKLNKILRE